MKLTSFCRTVIGGRRRSNQVWGGLPSIWIVAILLILIVAAEHAEKKGAGDEVGGGPDSEGSLNPDIPPEEEYDDIPVLEDIMQDADEGVSLDELEVRLMRQKVEMLKQMKAKLQEKVTKKISQDDLNCRL